ncbi:MAG: GNAT family N-acetyltransferase [Bryobacteraceae bacterium]
MFRLPIRESAYLQIMEERHAEAVYSVVDKDRERLRKWLPWVDRTTEAEYTREFIHGALEQFARNEGLSAAIWVAGRVAGGIGFHQISWLSKHVEMGYWISSEFEGRGIVTGASRAMIDYAFTQWKLNRVEIRCATGNARSVAIPKRLGFTLEGTLREAQLLSDGFHDLFVFGMLAKDWPAQQP